MEERNCKTRQKEFENTLALLPDMFQMEGKTVLVTGATGLIGSQLVKTLLCYNRLRGGHIQVIAVGRSREKLEKLYGHLAALSQLRLAVADVRQPLQVDRPVHYVFHCASVTASKLFVDQPVETIQTLLAGTENMLRFSLEQPVEAFVYLSSLEVYGVPTQFLVAEGDYGYIDFLSTRSSYSEGKRMAECLVKAYSSQYGVPAKIARLTQTIGCGIEYGDNRVFAQFAKSVIEKKDIILHTAGRTVRSYCDISDAVSALMYILLKGQAGEAYNVANPSTAISIGDMAKLFRDSYPEADIQVVFDLEDAQKLGYNPEMQISLDTEKLQALGWRAGIGLQEMIDKLVQGLREKAKD